MKQDYCQVYAALQTNDPFAASGTAYLLARELRAQLTTSIKYVDVDEQLMSQASAARPATKRLGAARSTIRKAPAGAGAGK